MVGVSGNVPLKRVKIRSLPGSVKDIKTLYHSINELDIGGKTLILERGFFSEGATKLLYKYSKVYHFEMGGRGMISEVPKKVMDLDEIPGLYMFPKEIRS